MRCTGSDLQSHLQQNSSLNGLAKIQVPQPQPLVYIAAAAKHRRVGQPATASFTHHTSSAHPRKGKHPGQVGAPPDADRPQKQDNGALPDKVRQTRSTLMDNVFVHVTDIIATELNTDPEKITPETSLTDDLGANELDLATLYAAIEEFFGCQIPIDQQEQMQTVQQIVNYLYGSPVYL